MESSLYSEDVQYAFIQIGIADNFTMAAAEKALERSKSYAFRTHERISQIERACQILAIREHFGTLKQPFEAVKAHYHRRVMDLHPDRQLGSTLSDEAMKHLTQEYSMLERYQREARAYFHRSLEAQNLEREAARAAYQKESLHQETLDSERSDDSKKEGYRRDHREAAPQSTERPIVYMAASVPRYIRVARLPYLPRDAIIGSRLVATAHSQLMYDYIMLTEKEFIRARLYLSTGAAESPSLNLIKQTPPYILRDTKVLQVPPEGGITKDDARVHFIKEFQL